MASFSMDVSKDTVDRTLECRLVTSDKLKVCLKIRAAIRPVLKGRPVSFFSILKTCERFLLRLLMLHIPVLYLSIADPESGAFLSHGSGILIREEIFPDLR
jgi:hypothetical protein